MTKKITLLIIGMLVSLTQIQAQDWIQLGADTDGETADDNSGWSVSLSSDGSFVAISAIRNDGNGTDAGHVRIYKNISGTWSQIGQDIDGEAAEDISGVSVSLSSDGSIVAIGAIRNDGSGTDAGHVRIFQNISGTWSQIGQDIDGEEAEDFSGISVSLSSDGSIVAIGACNNDGNGNDAGHVRIYKNISGIWTQIGQDIDGEAAGDEFGCSVSLSSDGSVVAAGAYYNDGNGHSAGHVRIFENQSGNWTQIGNDIDGEASGDWSGHSVDLSSDGSVLAIGAIRNEETGYQAGHVRIYQNNSGIWTQIGDDIDGEAANDYFGYSTSLSSNGSIVAISACYNDGNGSDAGHVRIYKNNAGTWAKVGDDIDGEAANDMSGRSINLSSDGSIVAIGAIWNDGNGSNAGHTRVYKTPIPIILTHPSDSINICPGAEVVFSVTGENIEIYQWKVSTDYGSTWSELSDDAVYSGSSTYSLTVITDISLNNYQYQCYLTNDAGNTTSNAAILSFENEVPVITSTHNDQQIDADANCEASLADYSGDVTATDNCDTNLDVTQNPTAGTTISGATNQVTLTITDDAGNYTETTFNIEVEDNTNPTISCVANQERDADQTHTYTVSGTEFDPTETSDNCGITSIENNYNSTSTLDGASLPEGTTTITWSITDNSGNTNNCSFDVLVNAYVGIENMHYNGISIYPNPTNGIINFEFSNNNIHQLIITDITGKILIKKITILQKEIIDLSNFENGIFIISIQADKEIIKTKIVKR